MTCTSKHLKCKSTHWVNISKLNLHHFASQALTAHYVFCKIPAEAIEKVPMQIKWSMVDSIAVSLFGWSKQIQFKSSPNRETAAATPPTLMRNFQQASTPSKVLESGVSWLISPPMHLNSLLDGLLGVFFFTKCQETSSKLEGDSQWLSNLGKSWIGFVSTAFHISFQWESPFLHHNWLPSNLGKCSIGFVGAANHISFRCDCWKVSKSSLEGRGSMCNENVQCAMKMYNVLNCSHQ